MESNFPNLTMESIFPDLTFVIPFYYDGEFRLENLNCILRILGQFKANVIVVEQGSYQHFTNADYYFNEAKVNGEYYFIPNYRVCQDLGIEIFYRTRIINLGLKKVTTQYAAIYDADVFFTPENYARAYQKLEEKYSFVYPYDGMFVDVDREFITTGKASERVSMVTGSYGGAVFLNLNDYQKIGLENENLIGWAPDDFERHSRADTFGLNICRIEGKCYHIYHPQVGTNPYNEQNVKEYNKVMNMKNNELTAYIKTWQWK